MLFSTKSFGEEQVYGHEDIVSLPWDSTKSKFLPMLLTKRRKTKGNFNLISNRGKPPPLVVEGSVRKPLMAKIDSSRFAHQKSMYTKMTIPAPFLCRSKGRTISGSGLDSRPI